MKKIIAALIVFSLVLYACVKKEPAEPAPYASPTVSPTITTTSTVPSFTATPTATETATVPTSTVTETVTETATATTTPTYPCTAAGEAGVLSANGGSAASNGQTIAYMIAVPEHVTISQVKVLINDSTYGAYDIDAAIYSDASGYPGAMQGAAGTLHVDDPPAASLVSVPLNVFVEDGNYWIAVRFKNNASNLMPFQDYSAVTGLNISIDQLNDLPASFPAGAGSINPPRMSAHWVCP